MQSAFRAAEQLHGGFLKKIGLLRLEASQRAAFFQRDAEKFALGLFSRNVSRRRSFRCRGRLAGHDARPHWHTDCDVGIGTRMLEEAANENIVWI
jgi:hypothetical protein